jgi:hypothetical protein
MSTKTSHATAARETRHYFVGAQPAAPHVRTIDPIRAPTGENTKKVYHPAIATEASHVY